MKRIVLLFLLLLLSWGSAVAQQANSDLMDTGAKLAAEGKFDEAFKAYETANKAGGKKCSQCFYRMSLMKLRMNDEADAKKFAAKAIETAQTPQEKADAYAMQGEALLAFGAPEDKKRAAQAESAYREAIKAGANYAVLHLRIGTCLVREGKPDDAKKEFQTFLDLEPNSIDEKRVRSWVDRPERALYPTAPEFEFSSLKEEKVSLAQLSGKVILLDFWGTWCPPCRASVPELKELIKKYPGLVVISVSSDTDEEKWKNFVADKKMDWIQYRDADKRILSAYHVHEFPTYVVIDKDGSIRERISGLDPQLSLRNRVDQVLKKIM